MNFNFHATLSKYDTHEIQKAGRREKMSFWWAPHGPDAQSDASEVIYETIFASKPSCMVIKCVFLLNMFHLFGMLRRTSPDSIMRK